jgi:hypothetical protein
MFQSNILSITNSPAQQIQKNSFVYRSNPSLTLKNKFMKKFILLITLTTAIIASGYCQADTSTTKINNEYTSAQYLLKAKNQKTAAWVCLGGGIALVTTGAILSASKVAVDYVNIFTTTEAKTSNYTGETILVLAGVSGMVASIPLFIASGNNKQKAKLMLTLQETARGLPSIVSKNVTGLTLSISL